MIKIVLKDVLISKDISVSQLSKATGITRQRLSNVVNNSVQMLSIKNLNTIQEYLNVPVSDLITSDKDNNLNKNNINKDIYSIYKELMKISKKLNK